LKAKKDKARQQEQIKHTFDELKAPETHLNDLPAWRLRFQHRNPLSLLRFDGHIR